MKQPPIMMMLIPEHVLKAIKGSEEQSSEGEPELCSKCGKMHSEEDLDEEEMADAEEEMSRVDMKKIMLKDRMRRMGKGRLDDDEEEEDYNG